MSFELRIKMVFSTSSFVLFAALFNLVGCDGVMDVLFHKKVEIENIYFIIYIQIV